MVRKFLTALIAFLALFPSMCLAVCYTTTIDGYRCSGFFNTCSSTTTNSCSLGNDNGTCGEKLPPPSTCPSVYGILINPKVNRVCTADKSVRITLSWGGYCNTQAEADSLNCVNAGNSWVNGSCQEPSKNDTTTYNDLVNRCENKAKGIANYRYNDKGNVVGYCDVCQTDENGTPTNPIWNQEVQNHKDFCCSIGASPLGDWSCNSQKYGCYGKNCDWESIGLGSADLKQGTCGIVVSNSTPAGCDVKDSINLDDLLNSSDSSEDTTQIGSSTSGDPIQDGLESILDSLHKIIVIDSTHRSIDSVSMTYLWRINDVLENWERDTTIVNVAGDTIINNVNVNQSQVVTAVNDLERVLNSNALKDSARTDSTHKLLDGILNALKGDTLSGNGLDTIQGQLDSLLGFYGDTTGAVAAGDTAGFMGGLDSIGKWLKDSTFIGSIFGSGDGALCDTTKGEKCASLGGSLDSAKSSYGLTAKALKDTLNGLVGDSLARWENAFTNNGVISGSGSASCPAVLSKNYEVVIKNNVKFSYNLGKYLCYDVGLGITLWALARVLLRAMVAISCMWWLYRAVTGVDGGGNDD